MRITKTFRFEAAHRLPNVPEGHKCARLHGHTYRVTVAIEGEVSDRFGWVQDYADLTAAWKRTGGMLDHTLLNDTVLNPTAELLALYLASVLIDPLPGLVEVTVHETPDTSAVWQRER